MHTLVLDIETAPWQHEEYSKLWPRSKKRPGLHAIISQVACIGLSDNGQISTIGRDQFPSEQAMLHWLDRVLREIYQQFLGVLW